MQLAIFWAVWCLCFFFSKVSLVAAVHDNIKHSPAPSSASPGVAIVGDSNTAEARPSFDLNEAPALEHVNDEKQASWLDEVFENKNKETSHKKGQWVTSMRKAVFDANPEIPSKTERMKLAPVSSLFQSDPPVSYCWMAIDAIKDIPVEDVALRTQTVRRIYHEKAGQLLSPEQLYRFFINHRLLPEITTRESCRLPNEYYEEGRGKVYTGRKMVEVLGAELRDILNQQKGLPYDDKRRIVVEYYQRHCVPGDLSAKARSFLRRWGYLDERKSPKEGKSRSTMILALDKLVNKIDKNDAPARRKCVYDFFAAKGFHMNRKQLYDYCYRHKIISAVAPKDWRKQVENNHAKEVISVPEDSQSVTHSHTGSSSWDSPHLLEKRSTRGYLLNSNALLAEPPFEEDNILVGPDKRLRKSNDLPCTEIIQRRIEKFDAERAKRLRSQSSDGTFPTKIVKKTSEQVKEARTPNERARLAKEAKALIADIPVEKLATRAVKIKTYYLEHGIDLSAKQIYGFFVKHHLLPIVQGKEVARQSHRLQSGLSKHYTGRHRVEILNNELHNEIKKLPPMSFDSLYVYVIQFYGRHGVTGNLEKKADDFLKSRYLYKRRGKNEARESPCALVQEVSSLLKDVDPSKKELKKQIIGSFYASKGKPMTRLQINNFCSRHRLLKAGRESGNDASDAGSSISAMNRGKGKVGEQTTISCSEGSCPVQGNSLEW